MLRAVTALLLMMQVADPIPDRIKLQISNAQRDMLKAADEKRAAMMAYNAAESRYESARKRLAEASQIATASCAPQQFNLDEMACAERK